MFCYQCEQTTKGTGCTSIGVCGKDPEVAALQDLLLYATMGIAQYATAARRFGGVERDVDVFVIEALFSTVTNVDFDPEHLETKVRTAIQVRDQAKRMYEAGCREACHTPTAFSGAASWMPASDRTGLVRQAEEIGVLHRRTLQGDEVVGLQELALYGLKGAAAYADHAQVLGVEDLGVYSSFHEVLAELAKNPTEVGYLTELGLKVGELNLKVMELLDRANTTAYGHPQPTKVRVTPLQGKAILVSGHDLKDLADLLEQTAGRGIKVYTHGEMLPAHGYPKLKHHPHLAGNYGGAWQDQQREFDAFPGAILMTTNCIQKPRATYFQRIFTSGLVAWPGVKHIEGRDFSPVIEAALSAPGFAEDAPEAHILVGFGHQAVLKVAGQVVGAVKNGKIKHFYLIGGCDGAKPGRNYYTEYAEAAGPESVILTLACGKFRFNKMEFGEIEGIPRLLDIGQCNDAYSAVQIALALAKEFNTDINGLPLTFVLSWYEQKAVAVLLTLLHLGVKNIHLGPTLPAFVTPRVLAFLSEKFGLRPTTTVEQDLAEAALAG